MTEPRTEAGRALLARFDRMANRSVWLRGLLNAPTILAIEAEAAAGVHLGDEGLRAADVLQKVQAICDEWGGHDSWGVHDIYVDTLMERLAAALATSAEGEDR